MCVCVCVWGGHMWMLIIQVINNLLLYVPSAIMYLDRSNPSEMYLTIITVKPPCKVLDCRCAILVITLYPTLRTILWQQYCT